MNHAPMRCEFTVYSVGARQCERMGYETYIQGGRRKVIRCWQHDPSRGIDKGEEAYRDHLA